MRTSSADSTGCHPVAGSGPNEGRTGNSSSLVRPAQIATAMGNRRASPVPQCSSSRTNFVAPPSPVVGRRTQIVCGFAGPADRQPGEDAAVSSRSAPPELTATAATVIVFGCYHGTVPSPGIRRASHEKS